MRMRTNCSIHTIHYIHMFGEYCSQFIEIMMQLKQNLNFTTSKRLLCVFKAYTMNVMYFNFTVITSL